MPADPQKLKQIKDLGRPEICFSIARVPQSSRVFYGASDSKVYHLDWAAEKLEPQAMFLEWSSQARNWFPAVTIAG